MKTNTKTSISFQTVFLQIEPPNRRQLRAQVGFVRWCMSMKASPYNCLQTVQWRTFTASQKIMALARRVYVFKYIFWNFIRWGDFYELTCMMYICWRCTNFTACTIIVINLSHFLKFCFIFNPLVLRKCRRSLSYPKEHLRWKTVFSKSKFVLNCA